MLNKTLYRPLRFETCCSSSGYICCAKVYYGSVFGSEHNLAAICMPHNLRHCILLKH
jgi:hypothetical protein